MARVFISHASADLDAAVKIRLWLRDAGHEVFLDRDLGEGIQIGEEWKRRLYRELRAADAVVCTITDDYRQSEWCSAEVGIADMLGCPLLPVRAAPGATSPLLEGLQYAELVADPDRARAELEQRLERIDRSGGSAWPDGRSPYPGLRPFETEMARVFRGRSVETRLLVARLRSLGERADGGLVVVVGPSGCGKSSLVRAGLVPAIAAESAWEVARPFTPGIDPVDQLARALAATANRLGMNLTIPATTERLAGETGLAGLAADLLIAGRRAPREQLLFVVDQGEELLTRSTPDELARFARLLAGALAGPVRTVITLRSEFLDRLRAVPELSTVNIEPFVLGPLDDDMLRAVIEEPAEVAGLHIEAELVDRLVADTPSGEALPLLAFSLAELARGKTRGDHLTSDVYAAFGGVQGALARHADLALAEAVESSEISAQAVVEALTRLATLDETDRPTARRVLVDGLPADIKAAYMVFVDHRLLVTTAEGDGTWISVAHEALLRAWPPLAEAVEVRRSALRGLRTIETAAAEWQSADERSAYLWDEKRLGAVQSTLALPGPLEILVDHPDLDPAARAFLAASVNQARVVRRTKRRERVGAVTVLSVLLAVAVALGAFAFVQASRERQRVEQAQHALVTQDLLARAEVARDTDQRLALKLGIAAYLGDPDDRKASAGLLQTVSRRHPIADAPKGHANVVTALALSKDGRLLVSGSTDRTACMWDVSDPTRLERLGDCFGGHPSVVTAVAISPDNQTVAAVAGRSVRIRDVTDRTDTRRLGPPLVHDSAVTSMAFSPRDRVLATSAANRILLWDLTDRFDPRLITQLRGHSGFVTSVAFSPDGRLLASGSGDESVRVWDVADPAARQLASVPLLGQTGWVNSVAFSPDGRTLASGSLTGVRLWDMSDPSRPRLRPNRLDGETRSVTFASNSPILAASSPDLGQRLWDMTDPARPREIDGAGSAEDGLRHPLALFPDGRSLAAASATGISIWDVSEPIRPELINGVLGRTEDPTQSVAFSPLNSLLAAPSFHRVYLWDLQDPETPRSLDPLPITGPETGVRSATFLKEGRVLAVVSMQQGDSGDVLTFWDMAAPADPQKIDEVSGIGAIHAVSSDGTAVATVSPTTEVPPHATQLWDVTKPAAPIALGPPLASRDGSISPVAFTADGSFFLTVDSDSIGNFVSLSMWDLSDPDTPRHASNLPLSEAQAVIDNVALSPDGRTLAVAASNFEGAPKIYLWDLADPAAPRLAGVPLVGEPDYSVGSLVFAPDGRTLVSGLHYLGDEARPGGAVSLWDIDDPTTARPLGSPIRTGPILSLGISPDGRSLAAVSEDQEGTGTNLRLWDTSGLVALRRDLMETACDQAGGFTRKEWDRLVPRLQFPDPCG